MKRGSDAMMIRAESFCQSLTEATQIVPKGRKEGQWQARERSANARRHWIM
ncbi:MAG: hypothetical protein ACR2LZ_03115 [Pyrinomonadaceae bacterium]